MPKKQGRRGAHLRRSQSLPPGGIAHEQPAQAYVVIDEPPAGMPADLHALGIQTRAYRDSARPGGWTYHWLTPNGCGGSHIVSTRTAAVRAAEVLRAQAVAVAVPQPQDAMAVLPSSPAPSAAAAPLQLPSDVPNSAAAAVLLSPAAAAGAGCGGSAFQTPRDRGRRAVVRPFDTAPTPGRRGRSFNSTVIVQASTFRGVTPACGRCPVGKSRRTWPVLDALSSPCACGVQRCYSRLHCHRRCRH
jgi:hypothetical protein